MFGDTSTQTDAAAVGAIVNPAMPPAGMGDPLASSPSASADNTSSFPAAPVADDSTTSPVLDGMTTDTPVVSDETTSTDIPAIPEIDSTLGQDLAAAAPAAMLDDSAATDTPAEPATDESSTSADEATETSEDTSKSESDDSTTTDLPAGTEELVDIKQQALEQLSPLVGQLEQTPEERFRTTMMMIQASDNQALVKQAFEAAQTITDDKARAQALLDVINEINYFTTQAKS